MINVNHRVNRFGGRKNPRDVETRSLRVFNDQRQRFPNNYVCCFGDEIQQDYVSGTVLLDSERDFRNTISRSFHSGRGRPAGYGQSQIRYLAARSVSLALRLSNEAASGEEEGAAVNYKVRKSSRGEKETFSYLLIPSAR